MGQMAVRQTGRSRGGAQLSPVEVAKNRFVGVRTAAPGTDNVRHKPSTQPTATGRVTDCGIAAAAFILAARSWKRSTI